MKSVDELNEQAEILESEAQQEYDDEPGMNLALWEIHTERYLAGEDL